MQATRGKLVTQRDDIVDHLRAGRAPFPAPFANPLRQTQPFAARHHLQFGRPKQNYLTPYGRLWLRVVTEEGPAHMATEAADIAKALAEEIHSGAIRAGEMIASERDLCERFAVGRTVVREAITMLEGMKLIEQRKGFRPRVVTPTLAQAMAGAAEAARFFFRGSEGNAHLEQARFFLEMSLVRYAAQYATQAQLGKMLAAIEACERAIGNYPLFREMDLRFHRTLAEVPGNPIFVALHDAFVDRLMRRREAPLDVVTHNRRSNDEHRAIVTALVARDEAEAVRVLTVHLSRNYATYMRQALSGAESLVGTEPRAAVSNSEG
jgi:DNA-binding FadR family transcriptional regulator